jgi:tetratricopeptide (TPR) repeat protein
MPGPIDILRDEFKALRKQLESQEKLLGADHIECMATLTEAATKLKESGNSTAAADAYRKAISGFDAKNIAGYNLFKALSGLGDILVADKKYAEAEPLLQRALALKAKMLPAKRPSPRRPRPRANKSAHETKPRR